ncbi:glycosyltransferase family 4 protein [Rhizobium sp. P32RR-XVIII]|uniref:glycosyltransferase family 4 protein n=1 Tax=Rhizobium sp. P32RR-XVIII TaxID=2726738 RepID=UPI0014573486|nr:glycosyltransferase family 4 protein [Rhizobium sp. P32RR-XVIII]NLS06361.1 glycosyltransferase family 4 protein [Rhizobium sp. P32RR-XVIII]
MTIDAIGGLRRYAMDLARALKEANVETVFAGLGPRLSTQQMREATAIGPCIWLDAPLDWMTDREDHLDVIPELLRELADKHMVDLLHLNLPSQAAGLVSDVPIVAVSHSCVVTWFEAMRGARPSADWSWQADRNRSGFDCADIVIAPSRSHAGALTRCYGAIPNLEIVHNCTWLSAAPTVRENFVFAAGRWWDEGKNGALLDRVATITNRRIVMAGPLEGPAGQHLTIGHAEHLGERSYPETVALMRRAGIVVSPSLYEPFGLAALEAARTGAALVLADIPIYRELWNGAALFADPHDPASFADAIDCLTADEDMRTGLGFLAQQRSGQFSPAAQCEAILRVYAQAMASTRIATG